MISLLAKLELDEITGKLPGYMSKPAAAARTTMEIVISNLIGFLTIAAGVTFIVYIVLAGVTWVTAREESERINRSKQMITNALVGLAIVAISWAFVGIMQTVFGFDILSPAATLCNVLLGGC